MPSTKDRLEALENLLLFTGGAVAGRVGPRAIVRGGARLAGAHPYALAATLAAEGWIHREEIADVASALGQTFEGTEPAGVRPAIVGREAIPAVRAVKRKVSKANKAVKKAVDLLKAGNKGATGADKGKLPKNYWKMATSAAGLANPNTPSKITKGTSKVKRLARTLRRWW